MLPPFKLEEFWKKYEFCTEYLFTASDPESWLLSEIVEMADPDSRKLWDNLHLGYTESPGHPILREEISKLYTSIKSDQVLTTAGAEEGIFTAMQCLVSAGDHVVIVMPCYESLENIPRSLGAEITSIPVDPKKNWKLSIDDFKRAFRPNTKALILNFPHNPTGALLDADVYKTIIEMARERGAYIFCDEVYRFMEVDEKKRMPAIADAYEKGISLNVMTKSFGLSGLRIGWLASRDATFMEKAGAYKLYLSICNSAPSEILAIIALRSKDKILKRNREIMLKNLELLDRFFERRRDWFRWIRPESGTIAFVELLLPVSIDQLVEELAEKAGVLIMPGSVFDFTGNFFRIGFGRKNMSEALERFEQYLESHANLH